MEATQETWREKSPGAAAGWRGARLATLAESRWLRVLALLAIVVVCTTALAAQYARWMGGYMTDDAYISFRYAQNLAEGLGPVWNPGQGAVEGYTNFAWVLLMAAAIKLGGDPVDASRALGLLASAGTIALVPLLAAQLRPAWTWRWWAVVAVASLALALNSGLSIWTFAGLETTGFAFLVTAAITAHLWEERTDGRRLWSAPLFVAAALMRPDGVVFFAVAALHKATRLLSSDRQERLPGLALWAALFAVPFGIYWLWRWSYYGHFYPNTYYLKTERSLAFFERGWEYARDFFVLYWGWLALAGLASVWRERAGAYRPATFLLGLSVAWFAYVIYSGGDWMPYYRFFVAALPFFYIVATHGIIDLADVVRERSMALRPAAFALMAVMLMLIPFSSIRPHDSDVAKQNELLPTMGHGLPGAIDEELPRSFGLWLHETFPPDTTIAQIATGVVPYYSRLPTLDMLGVNDEHIAHLDVPLGFGPVGHEKSDGAYIISRQPEFIWLMLGTEAAPRDRIELYEPPHWPRGFMISDQILNNGYIWDLYRPLAISYEGGGYFNLLVHRNFDLPPNLQVPIAD